MDEKGLGKRLQMARQNAGLTQQALCHKADISYSTLTKIERGAIKAPSIFTIQNIAEALGISLDELMAGTGSSSKSRGNNNGGKKRSKNGVSFVYFDINGCLVRFFHRAFARLSADTGAAADTVETAFWHYNDLVCKGEMSLAEFDQKLTEELGADELIDWKSYYMEAIEPIPAMHELVHWAARNYRVGLLTNIMPGFVPEMLERGLLPNVAYDAIVDSSEVHAIKPEPEIYEIAAERAHCSPAEILFIDDSRANLMAAGKQDWHVIWFDDSRPEEAAERIKTTLEPAN